MRLVTRLTAATAVVGLLVFGTYGVWLVAAERRDLNRAVDREVNFLATSLRVGIENALRDGQTVDVAETVEKLDEVDAGVDVLVLRPDGTPWVAENEEITELEWSVVKALALDVSEEGAIHWTRTAGPKAMLAHGTPLFADDSTLLGVLVILRPLSDVQEDIGDTVGMVSVTVGWFVLLAAGVGALVGRVFLVRPLARLMDGIRGVRSGANLHPLPEGGDVEVAALTAEFNRMTVDLAQARDAVARESEARRIAQHALQAADRLVTVGQLSAAVAHEIGSPLQVLHGRARTLAERALTPEQVRTSATVLVRETERISRIVEQVLAVARRRPARRARFDITTVARQVVEVMETEARRRRIHLETAWHSDSAGGQGGEMTGDADQLQQVALNLLGNALQATPAGGHVRIGTRSEPGKVALFVEDDGEGMDAQTAARAFDALFTTRGDHGGTGLGLAIVKSIVEDHGGRVSLRTEPGRGSTFTVEFPATPGAGEDA